ncbi:hypothetical protein N7490_009729 [Penicillium lividum]|nr:hypothetical protein N7490_009729 [Penicillium lividum]
MAPRRSAYFEMDEGFRPSPRNYDRRPPPPPFFEQNGDQSVESSCGSQRYSTHLPHSPYRRSKQKLPKIEYNQPRFSPYQLPLVNVALRVEDMKGLNDRHEIPANYLQKYPRIFDLLGPQLHQGYIHLKLSGISRRILHTIVHFVYTGEYETIETYDQVQYFDERWDVREEFEKSVEVYHAAKKYEIYGLQALAEKHMEHFGESMTLKEVISSTRNAFLDLPPGEIWLPNYVKKVIKREIVAGKSDANIRSLVGKRNLEGSADFNAAVLWVVIDILSARVHDLEGEAHIKNNIAPEVEDDGEPVNVAASETATATNISVRRPEDSTTSEDGFVVNGFTLATPEESATNESFASRSIPAAVAADQPDDPVPARPYDRVFGYRTFLLPPYRPSINRQTVNSDDFADEPESAGHVAADLSEEDVPAAEEPTVEAEEPFPEPPTEEFPTEGPPTEGPPTEGPLTEEPPLEQPPLEEPPLEEPPLEEPPLEEPATEPTLADMLLKKSYLYTDWKSLPSARRRKRSKKLRGLGLPVPDENGVVSIAL